MTKEPKRTTAAKQNFASWIENRMIQVPTTLKRVRRIVRIERTGTDVTLGQDPVLLAFCYSVEQLNLLMLTNGDPLALWAIMHRGGCK